MPNQQPRRRICGWLPFTMVIALVSCASAPDVEIDAGERKETGEDGGAVAITVSLARRPAGTINVYAVSSDTSEGRTSPAIQFDGRDWDRPQRITVTGVDDAESDGDVAYQVSIYEQAGRREAPRLIATVTLVNRDDESARFATLGDLPGGEQASYASDLSAAGDVVVGWSRGEGGDRAVRWTLAGGLVALSGPEGRAQAVSPDGRIVAGSIAESSYQGGRAGARWIEDQPYEVLEGPRIPSGGTITMMVVDGKAVRDDGRVYGTCIQYGAYGEPLACMFEAQGSVQTFGLGHVFAADALGNVAGTRQAERHAPFQSFATYDAETLPYPDGAQCSPSMGGCLATARDFIGEGALIVGTAHVPGEQGPSTLFDTAFTYSKADGARSLPDLPGGERACGAYGVSADGRVIVGFASDADGQQAVLWIDEEPLLLVDLLREAGAELPAGFVLSEVRAVSSDGRTFAGNGTNAQGAPEAFRAVLAAAP